MFIAAAAAKSLQSCPTLCDPMDSSPPRLLCPQDSPGKNTGVGCHFLLLYVHSSSFIIAKTQKQSKCPLTDECIKKMQFIYTMGYYSAVKENEIMSFATTCMN